MPVYNGAYFLAEAITSVIQQSYPVWELLIIDDASTDDSCSVAERFQKSDERIVILRLDSNQGAGIARNLGIKAATGDYIAFLDADDLWLPHKLETQLRFMKLKNQQLCYSSYDLINEKGLPLHQKIEALKQVNLEKMLKANYIGNLTGIYHSKSLGKIYCSPLRNRQDWCMWIEVVKGSGGALGIPESLAHYRIRKRSLSRNKLKLLPSNYNVYRNYLGFSFPKTCRYFSRFLFEQLFVKSKQKKLLSAQGF